MQILVKLQLKSKEKEKGHDMSYHLVPGHNHNNLGILLKVYQYTSL